MPLNFVAVGDVGPDRPDPATIFDHVRERLRRADLGFGQLEVNETTRGVRLPQVRHTIRGPIGTAAAMVGAGLHVVSFAGNHTMDWGAEGMADTMTALKVAGAQGIGAGPDLDAAMAPAVVERAGHRIGILAVSSILPQDTWATETRPGAAPLRAHTVYEQIETDQPGTPARVHTFARRDDLDRLLAAIRALRDRVDVLILSHHAGIHFVPAVIPDYQREVAHAAIDAGADMVLGTHAHILKGVEFHRGRPIVHSLANFAIELPMTAEHAASKGFREIRTLHPGWEADLTSRYNFPPDSAMTMTVEATFDGGRMTDFALVPAMIGRDADPRWAEAKDAARIRDYLEEITAAADLSTRYALDGDVIRAAPG